MNFFYKIFFLQKGYIALISILIIGAVCISITVSLLLLGLGSSRSSFAFQQSTQAWALTNACIEEGLQKIRDSVSYTGIGSLTMGVGTCSYEITNQGGNNRTIIASGTISSIIRQSKVIINGINPQITVTSWLEL